MLCSRPVARVAVAPRAAAPRPLVAAARPCVAARAVEAPTPASASFADDAEEARAILRFARGSPHKFRRVLDTIRGRTYEDALKILTFMPYRATEPILKVLLSAGANAKQNLGMRKSKLYVSECFCDEGPIMKRFRPRAQGRAYRIQKKTAHITIMVAEQES